MEVDTIFKQLVKIGFSKRRIGTIYIAEATVYIYKNKLPITLEGKVYNYIAKKYSTKVTSVKSNMIMTCISASENIGKTVTTKYIITHLLKYNLRKKNIF